MNRPELIAAAVGQTETYRTDIDDRDLEIGHLYGMADLITALTLGETESFSDAREAIAQEIDRIAGQATYRILN